MDTGDTLGVKRPKHEADHSPPPNAEVKNAWSYSSIPQYAFIVWCLVKHSDNFNFTFSSLSSSNVLRKFFFFLVQELSPLHQNKCICSNFADVILSVVQAVHV
jgi:hypothetical protein